MTQRGDGDIRELRLALVCYGGVSLAVYMHGVTKELRKLVVASRAFEQHPDENPFEENETERAYFEALRALAASGTPARVVVDVISGTSAGGINGVFLAKALACDGDDAALMDLWLRRGDIGGLLHAPRWLPFWLRLAVVATRLLLRPTSRFTPLRGDDMSRWLYDALHTIGPGTSELPLVPRDERLRLFVTTTDLHGYDRLVESGTGDPTLHDRTYRQVFEFTHEPDGKTDFDPDSTAALALAARCTSSIPGAFPPVRLREFAADLAAGPRAGGRRCDLDAIVTRYFAAYDALDVMATELVDGGVLDNAPFDHAIDAIAAQRARTEVIRHVVYLEPDPGPEPVSAPGPTTARRPTVSGWLSTVFTTLMKVSRHEPLLDQLLRLRELDERIALVGVIANEQMDSVRALLDEPLRAAAPPPAVTSPTAPGWIDALDRRRLESVAASVHPKAAAEAGLAFNTYARLKLQDAAARLAAQVAERFHYPPDTSRATFVGSVLSAWMSRQPAFHDPGSPEAVRLLGRIDLGYRERRLRFVLQGVNALYGAADAPPRAALDEVKGALWDLLDELAALPGATAAQLGAPELELLAPTALVEATLRSEPAAWAMAHDVELGAVVDSYGRGLAHYTADSGARLWETFQRLTAGWDDSARLPLAVRYVGFPVWDTLIFPIVALSALPQLSPIRAIRFSPDRATLLKAPGTSKLRGISFHHFAAFFHRDWRENDYLWGRLDGAELILRLVAGLGASGPSTSAFDARVAASAFAAVLRSETDLTSRTTVSLVEQLAEQVERLGTLTTAR